MPKQQVTVWVDVPDGYEATGEWRFAEANQPHAHVRMDGSSWAVLDGVCDCIGPAFILRRVKSPTVMVEMPRSFAERVANSPQPVTVTYVASKDVIDACRAALKAEAETVQPSS